MNKTERLTALYTLAAAVEENEDEIADELRKKFFGTDVQTINSRLCRGSVVDGWKGKRVPNPEFPQWLKCKWLSRAVAKRILEEGENE